MHARSPWAFLLAACWPALSIAALDPTDTVQVQATLSYIHDNNLYRLPDVDSRIFGIDPGDKSDTTLVKGVGLRLDKTVGRQRLLADVNVRESTYEKNDELDFVGGEGRLSWLWQVGNNWSGEATYRRSRTLGGFADFRLKLQDLIDTQTYFLSAGYLLHPRWKIGVDASEQHSDHGAEARSSLDYEARSIGAELRYRTPADNTVALQARRTDRNYPNRILGPSSTIDNGHREMRLNALGLGRIFGLTRLEGQVGYADVQHDSLDQRDFSGTTWRAGAVWDATGKLRMTAKVFKDIRLYEDIATSYIVVNGINLSSIYALTTKVAIQADYIYEKRDFRGDPGFFLVDSNREDKTRLARLGVTYSPLRNLDLSLNYEKGTRRSNVQSPALFNGSVRLIDINDYSYDSWFATVRVGF